MHTTKSMHQIYWIKKQRSENSGSAGDHECTNLHRRTTHTLRTYITFHELEKHLNAILRRFDRGLKYCCHEKVHYACRKLKKISGSLVFSGILRKLPIIGEHVCLNRYGIFRALGIAQRTAKFSPSPQVYRSMGGYTYNNFPIVHQNQHQGLHKWFVVSFSFITCTTKLNLVGESMQKESVRVSPISFVTYHLRAMICTIFGIWEYPWLEK